jgi:hypothetical protein
MLPPDLHPPRQVFVSYSHDSPAHMDRVLALCDRLRRDGIDAEVDQYEPAPPEGWPRWTLRRIEAADFVLVVCTETYRRRFDGKEERGRGLGVTWEGAVLTQVLYDAAAVGGKLVPVVFAPEDEAHVPIVLRGVTRHDLGSEGGYEQLYRHLTHQPAAPRPSLGTVLSLPPRSRESSFLWTPPAPRARAWPRIALAAFLGGALALGGYLTFRAVPGKQALEGEILDSNSLPLSGVKVSLPDFDLDTTTDRKGRYHFEVAVPRETRVKLRATKDGYVPINVDPPAGTGYLDQRLMWRSR